MAEWASRRSALSYDLHIIHYVCASFQTTQYNIVCRVCNSQTDKGFKINRFGLVFTELLKLFKLFSMSQTFTLCIFFSLFFFHMYIYIYMYIIPLYFCIFTQIQLIKRTLPLVGLSLSFSLCKSKRRLLCVVYRIFIYGEIDVEWKKEMLKLKIYRTVLYIKGKIRSTF